MYMYIICLDDTFEMPSHKNVWKDPYGLFSAVQLDYCLCLALDRLQRSDQRERGKDTFAKTQEEICHKN